MQKLSYKLSLALGLQLNGYGKWYLFFRQPLAVMCFIKKYRTSMHSRLSCALVAICITPFGSLMFIEIPSIYASSKDSPATNAPLLQQKWKGDFDGMVERHEIRVLVVYSKTFYFIDKGQQRGLSYDGFKEFEKFVNTKLGK